MDTTAPSPVAPEVLDALRSLDTPSICNALEVVAPERRGYGYTIEPFFCRRPESAPIVGYARTATIKTSTPPEVDGPTLLARRIAYYDYTSSAPGPTITVVEDVDERPCYGSWWGEVNTHVHRGLGSLGVITNGTVRDLDDVADGFQLLAGMPGPSHAWVRVESFGEPVTVHGMRVESGDLVHADKHGAVVIPTEVAGDIAAAAEANAAKEQRLVSASLEPGFDADRIAEVLGYTRP